MRCRSATSSTSTTAVAIRGERIVVVGNDAEILPLAGEATRVLDLGGGGEVDITERDRGGSHEPPPMVGVKRVESRAAGDVATLLDTSALAAYLRRRSLQIDPASEGEQARLLKPTE